MTREGQNVGGGFNGGGFNGDGFNGDGFNEGGFNGDVNGGFNGGINGDINGSIGQGGNIGQGANGVSGDVNGVIGIQDVWGDPGEYLLSTHIPLIFFYYSSIWMFLRYYQYILR